MDVDQVAEEYGLEEENVLAAFSYAANIVASRYGK